ncbi:hypothetical protein RchiOBHm_Chr7g0199001 [Rosa chinensis]|uniref:Uncharacterized protein n=1 Tax=Rosa chinensis TaxID=74649 RepID=A0A2P6P7A5_ROSCH|nr:hypothetical protein RchiOBHm_Chr7g0199001 [Rosa chinensis]
MVYLFFTSYSSSVHLYFIICVYLNLKYLFSVFAYSVEMRGLLAHEMMHAWLYLQGGLMISSVFYLNLSFAEKVGHGNGKEALKKVFAK